MNLPVHDGLLQIFNVDLGQCSLLTIPAVPGAKHVLIDSGHAVNLDGTGSWYPDQHLSSLGIKHVDLLICTNYDEDHASGFPDLRDRNISIGCILGNPSVAPETIIHRKSEDGMGAGIRALAGVLAARRASGHVETIPSNIPGFALSLAANPYPYFDDENNLSLVTALDIASARPLHRWVGRPFRVPDHRTDLRLGSQYSS